jgi:hypothetical protein
VLPPIEAALLAYGISTCRSAREPLFANFMEYDQHSGERKFPGLNLQIRAPG